MRTIPFLLIASLLMVEAIRTPEQTRRLQPAKKLSRVLELRGGHGYRL